MNLSCTPGGTIGISPITNSCICDAPYYGDRCEYYRLWWFSLDQLWHTIQAIALLIIFVWSIAVAISKSKKNQIKSLVGMALLLQGLACATRIVWLVLPGKEIQPYATDISVSLAENVLVAVSVVLWLASHSMTMAFWNEIWVKKIKADGSIAKSTKITLIVATLLFFACTMIGLLYLEAAYPLGFLVYYIPLVLIVVLLMAFTIRLSRFNTKGLSGRLQERHKWVSRLFVTLVVNWFFYCLVLIIWALNSTNAFAMVGYIVFRLCETIAAIGLALLVDYKAKVFRCLKSDDISRSSSTGRSGSGSHKSSSTSGSKSQSMSTSNKSGSDMDA